MRCFFADELEFRAWAESVANAVRLYAGRIDRIPPYALPYILRNPSAAVPAADAVPPELVADWGALVDELNTAITEVFADAPPVMTAKEMPNIIATRAGGLKWDGSFDVTPSAGKRLICSQGTISLNDGQTVLYYFDPSSLTFKNNGSPANIEAHIRAFGLPDTISGYGIPDTPLAFSHTAIFGTSLDIGANDGFNIGDKSLYFTVDWLNRDFTVTGSAKLYYKII